MRREFVVFWFALAAGLALGVGLGATAIDLLFGTGAEAQEIYRRGHDNGYASGFEDGFEEGQNASFTAPTPDVDYRQPTSGLPYTWWWFGTGVLLTFTGLSAALHSHEEAGRSRP